jgi:hypothetical protein
MGLLLSHKLKKPNPVVNVYAGASAPPPPVNPHFVVRNS